MFIPPNADARITAEIVNGQLDNDNFRLLPALALNKLATGALPTGITVASANIVNDTIVNADVNSAAAIAYSKLNLASSIVNADVANAAAIAISKTTLGTYTAPTTWTPTWTGFSIAPTGTAYYSQIGNIVFITWMTSAAGTSDNVGTFITNLPVTPTVSMRQNCSQQLNNGGLLPDPAMVDFVAASATATFYKDLALAAWTNSGTKYVNFSTWYIA